jgi:hypothetical protein
MYVQEDNCQISTNICKDVIYIISVWRDGTFNEFQNTWNEQPIIPGYVSSGTETDYDKEIDGIQVFLKNKV